MNDKLHFTFSKIDTSVRPVIDQLVTVAIRQNPNAAYRDRSLMLVFSLHKKVLDQLEWTPQDMIDLTIAENQACLFPSPAGGRRLRANKAGERQTLNYTIPRELSPWKNYSSPQACVEVEVEDGKVAFLLPVLT